MDAASIANPLLTDYRPFLIAKLYILDPSRSPDVSEKGFLIGDEVAMCYPSSSKLSP